MIFESKTISTNAVFSGGTSNKAFIISSAELIAKKFWIFTMVPLQNWEPEWDKAFKCSQSYFLQGSGFGGGAFFKEVYFYKHCDGAVYRDLV